MKSALSELHPRLLLSWQTGLSGNKIQVSHTGSWRNCPQNVTKIAPPPHFQNSSSRCLKSGSKDSLWRGMARIPDDLVVFLIGEIASSGQQGESFPSSSGMRQICLIVLVGKVASLPSKHHHLHHNLPQSVSNHYLMPIPCSPDVSTINDLKPFQLM
jgi:hypothetical protein